MTIELTTIPLGRNKVEVEHTIDDRLMELDVLYRVGVENLVTDAVRALGARMMRDRVGLNTPVKFLKLLNKLSTTSVRVAARQNRADVWYGDPGLGSYTRNVAALEKLGAAIVMERIVHPDWRTLPFADGGESFIKELLKTNTRERDTWSWVGDEPYGFEILSPRLARPNNVAKNSSYLPARQKRRITAKQRERLAAVDVAGEVPHWIMGI